MSAFDSAVIVGRFNSFHNGHDSLVKLALTLADRVVIFVGSSQESGTERNPFTVETRMACIRAIWNNDRVDIRTLPDLTNEHDLTPEWGIHVIKHFKQVLFKVPELMIYGNDEARSLWFDPKDISNVTEVIVNRNKLPISGTMMRELLLADEVEAWMEHTPPRMHKLYPRLRAELLTVPYYRNIRDGGLTCQ